MEDLSEIEKLLFASAFAQAILMKISEAESMNFAIKVVESYRYILPRTWEYDRL
jgi:hypothetical protein